MTLKKDPIKVGNTTMFATTVPVNVIYDEVYDPPTFPAELVADRFQILELDGYYLVVHEMIYQKIQPAKQEFKCFLGLDDAKSYLKMFGVEFEEDNDNVDQYPTD